MGVGTLCRSSVEFLSGDLYGLGMIGLNQVSGEASGDLYGIGSIGMNHFSGDSGDVCSVGITVSLKFS